MAGPRRPSSWRGEPLHSGTSSFDDDPDAAVEHRGGVGPLVGVDPDDEHEALLVAQPVVTPRRALLMRVACSRLFRATPQREPGERPLRSEPNQQPVGKAFLRPPAELPEATTTRGSVRSDNHQGIMRWRPDGRTPRTAAIAKTSMSSWADTPRSRAGCDPVRAETRGLAADSPDYRLPGSGLALRSACGWSRPRGARGPATGEEGAAARLAPSSPFLSLSAAMPAPSR
jgi:hypothetical protein